MARTVLALTVTVGLLATGCTEIRPAGPPAPSNTAGTDPVSWRPCPEVAEEALAGIVPGGHVSQLIAGTTYECTTLSVPQDWSAPGETGTFEIALVRARRGEEHAGRIGSLLINPGGPGASGVEAAVYLTLAPLFGGLPQRVTDRFDVIGFDPRGWPAPARSSATPTRSWTRSRGRAGPGRPGGVRRGRGGRAAVRRGLWG